MARAEIYTYFTRATGVTELLYSAEEQIRLKLTLEDAGPVAISTRENISPVLSGKGILLTTNLEQEFVLSRGDRLFIVSNTVNRVKFIVEPIPYVPQILAAVLRIFDIRLPDLAPKSSAPPPKGRPIAPPTGPPRRPPGAARPKFRSMAAIRAQLTGKKK